MTPPRALLFDFDGVLADTENIHVAAWQRTLADLGWEVPDAACARAAEEDDRDFLGRLFAERGIEGGDVEGWVRRKQELTLRMLADSPRVYPGVAELVAAVRQRVKLAVVSTTWRVNIETVLRAAGLADAFTLLIGKEDVKAPKPAPDGYRLALRRLKVKPAEAVALEDSATGLIATQEARVRVVIVGHRKPGGAWIGTAGYVAGLTPTDRVLEALGLAPSSGD